MYTLLLSHPTIPYSTVLVYVLFTSLSPFRAIDVHEICILEVVMQSKKVSRLKQYC